MKKLTMAAQILILILILMSVSGNSFVLRYFIMMCSTGPGSCAPFSSLLTFV